MKINIFYFKIILYIFFCILYSILNYRGPEIVTILEEIKVTFRKSIDKIRQTEQDKILDVKVSSWHDEFNAFKIGMKDLDIMY